MDLGKSPKTIKAYLRQCKEMGLVRAVSVSKGIISLYYMAVAKTLKMRGLESVGTTYVAGLLELRTLRFANVEAQAMRSQQQSYFAMVKDLQKQNNSKRVDTNTSDEIFQSSHNVRGAQSDVIHVSGRYVFVSESFTAFGGSLSHIASGLGRTERTAQRRLSNKYRIVRGVKSVDKKQIAQKQNVAQNNWKAWSSYLLDEGLFNEAEVKEYRKTSATFNIGNNVFQAKCNLYQSNIELVSKAHWRKDLKLIIEAQ